MQIEDIWVSQRKLRCPEQLAGMIEALADGGLLPPIILNRLEDDTIQVEDGHHRLSVVWLSGRCCLEPWEYLLLEKDAWRPKFGKLADLLERCGIESDDWSGTA